MNFLCLQQLLPVALEILFVYCTAFGRVCTTSSDGGFGGCPAKIQQLRFETLLFTSREVFVLLLIDTGVLKHRCSFWTVCLPLSQLWQLVGRMAVAAKRCAFLALLVMAAAVDAKAEGKGDDSSKPYATRIDCPHPRL